MYGERREVESAVGKPTWAELVQRERRLGDLMAKVRRVREDPDFCANATWYGAGDDRGVREEMAQLVGWDRIGDPVLGTEDAYDVAYDTLYEELPDCRHAAEERCRG